MEPSIVAVIILVVLIGGTVAALAWQRPSLSLPALRTFGLAGAGANDEAAAKDAALGAGADPGEPGLVAARASSRLAPEPLHPVRDREEPPLPEPVRLDIAPTAATRLHERLDGIEARLREMQSAIERQNAQIVRASEAAQRRAEAHEAQQEAALERLRADINAMIGRLTPEHPGGGNERRIEVSAELYARLARFESALAAVTNPVLLPGEPYEAPGELLTEALIWENWNEVGERAFALADAYSAQRLYLSGETRAEVGEFVTALRLLLTRSIYPNLHTDLNAAQQSALRDALNEIAVELPRLRATLDREYRNACGA